MEVYWENHWTHGLSNGQVWRGMDMFFCIFFSGQAVEGFEMIRVKESDKNTSRRVDVGDELVGYDLKTIVFLHRDSHELETFW